MRSKLKAKDGGSDIYKIIFFRCRSISGGQKYYNRPNKCSAAVKIRFIKYKTHKNYNLSKRVANDYNNLFEN